MQLHRALADRAAHRAAALLAGQHRQVAGSWHLNQDGSGCQSGANRLEDQPGQPGATALRVALQREVGIGGGPHRGAAVPHLGRGQLDRVQPAPLAPGLDLRGATVAGQQQRGLFAACPQRHHVAGVRIGGVRLGMQIVAVVPQADQSEVGYRRVDGRTSADDDLGLAADDRKIVAVPGGGAQVGMQFGDRAQPDDRAQPVADLDQIAVIGHHDDDAAPGAQGGDGGLNEPAAPVVHTGGIRDESGTDLPVAAQWLAVRQPGQEGVAVGIADQTALGHLVGDRQWPAHLVGVLGAGVPRRDGEPDHVGEGAGIVIGDRPDQLHLSRAEDRGGRDDLGQRGQLGGDLSAIGDLHDIAVAQPAGKPHPHPHAGPHIGGLGLGDRVVEQTVQMRKRDVHRNPGDHRRCPFRPAYRTTGATLWSGYPR